MSQITGHYIEYLNKHIIFTNKKPDLPKADRAFLLMEPLETLQR